MMKHSEAKNLFLDIMVDGTFFCQLPMLMIPYADSGVREYDYDRIEQYILTEKPELRTKDYVVRISSQKI